MVTQNNIKSMKLYRCDECLLLYVKEKYAKQCEKWCKDNKSCNLKITKHASKELSENIVTDLSL